MTNTEKFDMTEGTTILDDGKFYIELNGNYEACVAPGTLWVRCSHSAATPGGYDCAGGFNQARDGTWEADVNVPWDSETESDSRLVATGVSRLDAIVALWRERHAAYYDRRHKP